MSFASRSVGRRWVVRWIKKENHVINKFSVLDFCVYSICRRLLPTRVAGFRSLKSHCRRLVEVFTPAVVFQNIEFSGMSAHVSTHTQRHMPQYSHGLLTSMIFLHLCFPSANGPTSYMPSKRQALPTCCGVNYQPGPCKCNTLA